MHNHDAVTIRQVVELVGLRHAAAPGAQQLHMRIFRQLQEAIVAVWLEAQQGVKRAPVRPLDEDRFSVDDKGPVVMLRIGSVRRRPHFNGANAKGKTHMIGRAGVR